MILIAISIILPAVLFSVNIVTPFIWNGTLDVILPPSPYSEYRYGNLFCFSAFSFLAAFTQAFVAILYICLGKPERLSRRTSIVIFFAWSIFYILAYPVCLYVMLTACGDIFEGTSIYYGSTIVLSYILSMLSPIMIRYAFNAIELFYLNRSRIKLPFMLFRYLMFFFQQLFTWIYIIPSIFVIWYTFDLPFHTDIQEEAQDNGWLTIITHFSFILIVIERCITSILSYYVFYTRRCTDQIFQYRLIIHIFHPALITVFVIFFITVSATHFNWLVFFIFFGGIFICFSDFIIFKIFLVGLHKRYRKHDFESRVSLLQSNPYVQSYSQ